MKLNVLAAINRVELESLLVSFFVIQHFMHCEGFVIEHCCYIYKRAADLCQESDLIYRVYFAYQHACDVRSYLMTRAPLVHEDAAP